MKCSTKDTHKKIDRNKMFYKRYTKTYDFTKDKKVTCFRR